MDKKNIIRHTINTLAAILATGLFAFLHWYFTNTADQWYVGLIKPSFLPPDSVIIPCWAATYILMAVSLFRLLNKGGFHGWALYLSMLSLALLPLWNFIFFAGENVVTSFAAGIFALLCWGYTGLCSFRRNKAAGLLLIAPVLWIGFCTTVNYMLFMLN